MYRQTAYRMLPEERWELPMLYFLNDYSEGAHPEVLKRLCEENLHSQPGYGSDCFTASAKEKIKKACGMPDAEVWFLTGGTQTNAVMIDALLRSFEGVVSVKTGHVAGHEAGAIEFTGHKVLELPEHEGKMDAAELDAYLAEFYQTQNYDHMVCPGMVYISHPTEYGTLYTKAELTVLRQVCDRYQIPLYIDGARMGYGLMSTASDMTLPDVANLCDAFYIGGTKIGALCGEAVVFTKHNAPKSMLTFIKQHGALMAKGRLLGIQFDTLFTDDLYFTISRHAIDRAMELKAMLLEKGYRLLMDSPTNQQFVILENSKVEELSKQVMFNLWEPYDENHTVIRLVTSWATTKESIEELAKLL